MVDLVGDGSSVALTDRGDGRSKLDAVEDVEELGAELQVGPLVDGCRFLEREIEVLLAVSTEGWVNSGFVAEGPGCRGGKAAGIEPRPRLHAGKAGGDDLRL